jgi:outer membrane protein
MHDLSRSPSRLEFAAAALVLALGFGFQGAVLAGDSVSLAESPKTETSQTELGVDEVLARTLQNNPRLLAARQRERAALDAARSLRGRMLPTVHLSDQLQHYDSAYDIAFGTSAFTARDQDTNTFAAAASQPLVGLVHLSQDTAALYSDADAAAQATRALENNLREEVQTQYLRLFEARATREIAQTSQAQLGEQLTVGRSRRAAGVVTDADVLRLQVAVENARQQEILAHAQEDVAHNTLLALMGLPPTTLGVSFREPTELETAAAPTVELSAAISTASRLRPELAAASSQARAAQLRSRSKFFQLLPEVNLELAYANIQGQAFAPTSSAYVGLRADWNVFTWGANLYAWRAASALSEAASRELEGLRQQNALEVSARLLQVQSAAGAVAGAAVAVESAGEAWRVTDALLKAGNASTTDLLDAQSALVQARLNLVRARYQLAQANVSLKHAMGE